MGIIETKQSILKLIREAEDQFAGTGKALLDIEDYVAEYLTAKGVLVPPCKVGDTVYEIDFEFESGDFEVACSEVLDFAVMTYYNIHRINELGKTVFLSREEAEAALKGR